MDYSLIVKKDGVPHIIPNSVLKANEQIVDGELVYMLSMDVWNSLEKVSDCQGLSTIALPDYLCKMLEKRIEFAHNNVGFSTIVYGRMYRGIEFSFFTDVVYYCEGRWNRVSIENARCNNCHWRGFVANPTGPGLFDSVKDRAEALRRAATLPQVSCPRCQNVLSNYAIWTST